MQKSSSQYQKNLMAPDGRPVARKGEAEWAIDPSLEGEGSNCFGITQLVG